MRLLFNFCTKNAAFSYSKRTTRNRNEANLGCHAKIIQDTFKTYSKQSNKRSKHDYTINYYQTTSNIIINGPEVTKFMNHELKLIAKC